MVSWSNQATVNEHNLDTVSGNKTRLGCNRIAKAAIGSPVSMKWQTVTFLRLQIRVYTRTVRSTITQLTWRDIHVKVFLPTQLSSWSMCRTTKQCVDISTSHVLHWWGFSYIPSVTKVRTYSRTARSIITQHQHIRTSYTAQVWLTTHPCWYYVSYSNNFGTARESVPYICSERYLLHICSKRYATTTLAMMTRWSVESIYVQYNCLEMREWEE